VKLEGLKLVWAWMVSRGDILDGGTARELECFVVLGLSGMGFDSFPFGSPFAIKTLEEGELRV